MSKKKFTDLQITSPEVNSIRMMFFNESDAADFRIWWDRSGSASFNAWKERGNEFYDKVSTSNRCTNCSRICVGKCCDKCIGE